MSERCPNCGDAGARPRVQRCNQDGWVCKECGTIDWDSGGPEVPRRSQPAEVLELPDSDGDWWWWDAGASRWRVKLCSTKVNWGPGRYVRCVPPIVAEPVDEDAEKLRQLVNGSFRFTYEEHEFITRIADDLERLRRAERGRA